MPFFCSSRLGEMPFPASNRCFHGVFKCWVAEMCFAAKASGEDTLVLCGLTNGEKSRTEKKIAILKVETCEMYPKHSERERERQRVDMAHPVPLKFLPLHDPHPRAKAEIKITNIVHIVPRNSVRKPANLKLKRTGT